MSTQVELKDCDPGLRDPIEPSTVASVRASDPPSIIARPGEPTYMIRWRVLRLFGWEMKFHVFLRSDDDCLHDHPWGFMSIMLAGSYCEITPIGQTPPRGAKVLVYGSGPAVFCRVYRAPCIIFRRARHKHRVELIDGAPVLTFNISTPRVRNWGFWTKAGWLPWRLFNEGRHRC